MEKRVKNKIEGFLKRIKEIFGERILSCILYGSVVKGTYNPKNSDINLIIIVDRFEAKDLDAIRKKVSKYALKNLIRPFFFSEFFFLSSTDIFPIEWKDIKENHLIVYGNDLTENIKIENENLRIELERKIKQLFLDFQQELIFEKNKILILEETVKNLKFLIPLIEECVGEKINIPEISNKDKLENKIDELLKFFSDIIILIEKNLGRRKK
ncbi:MAG: nucleotidyltransferase domain-containing protein [Candidatus Omnitrophica bacterium]|nr:nucleotidyltransferase domain-containing protein [Candidatus Omnitrophota bacterium]MCM8809310.1 nucleotidyltransferase domain-containing protein [Candidatus Omnitrophota bacterium]MCM8811168.1 nucleotidyltransferase domain-containing protein [Candidatus Omnitrophota bacterium]MCM8832495.1 nucleotidyltransferase domain-containing protein [Candidatus Omnitrophota bacterium]